MMVGNTYGTNIKGSHEYSAWEAPYKYDCPFQEVQYLSMSESFIIHGLTRRIQVHIVCTLSPLMHSLR